MTAPSPSVMAREAYPPDLPRESAETMAENHLIRAAYAAGPVREHSPAADLLRRIAEKRARRAASSASIRARDHESGWPDRFKGPASECFGGSDYPEYRL